METKNKSEFIDRWFEHINTLNILALCPESEHAKQVAECRDKLKDLVVQIAETKNLK